MPEANLLRLPKSMQRNLYNDLQIARNTLFCSFFLFMCVLSCFLGAYRRRRAGRAEEQAGASAPLTLLKNPIRA